MKQTFGQITGISGNMVTVAVEDNIMQNEVAYIIKEAITNARKHGGANRVEVSIVRDDCGSRITVKDDGTGFDTLTISGEDAQQMGLQIMRERARSVKGDLEVRSVEGEGTSVTLCVPVDHTK